MKTIKAILFVFLVFLFSCNEDNSVNDSSKNLTIFFVNDVHSKIDNFSKAKYIIDAEREITNVIVASSGDLFSGNPVVDNYEEKGYPIIDIMNDIGFDISVVGNHEFDYGVDVLKDRMEQANFPWVCANVDVGKSGLPDLPAYHTISIGDLKITFLGLIETGGSNNKIIPATHPNKIKELTFERAQNVVKDYMQLKSEEDADLLIALSHLGVSSYNENIGDFDLARQNYFFDLIISGHNHIVMDTTISKTPIFQAGGDLDYLGKIQLSIKNKTITSVDFDLIDLNTFSDNDKPLQAKIETYNNWPELKEVIGYSHQYHSRSQVGCFYTDAMRLQMNVDVAFQNTGGVRSTLQPGDIIKRKIYEISPFNNGTIIFEMTVAEIKQFLIGSESGFYYSGIIIRKTGDKIIINDIHNREIPDDYLLSVGINDYIPAVHPMYFPDNGILQSLTAAETLIAYLENINNEVDYQYCNRYFRY